jgi:hypothetical protein
MRNNRGKQPTNENRSGSEPQRRQKCPLLLTTEIERIVKPDFINSIGQQRKKTDRSSHFRSRGQSGRNRPESGHAAAAAKSASPGLGPNST